MSRTMGRCLKFPRWEDLPEKCANDTLVLGDSVKEANIVFSDGKGKNLLRISSKNGFELFRENFPDFSPDDFVEKFLEILGKSYDVRFDKKEE